ncbi:MAG TPA: glycosyltransferase, partial [Candidatus Sumerlaeota bacterium]|nr:glycosyltransferase [Candidatus Sumerlaeota bacterium]
LQDAYAAMNAALFLAQGSEGGSRSIMEAMGCARPVIAATCGAVPEMIRDSVTGYLVTKDDAGALADRILDILKDTKRAADMGREARIFAENRYRLLERAEQIMDFYEALQSRKS